MTNDNMSDHEVLCKFIPRNIEVKYINILAQPRQTFEEITELAESIRQEGQIQPVVVNRLTKAAAIEYLGTFNRLYGTSFTIADLLALPRPIWRIWEEPKYDILIAGERRTRAIKQIGQKFVWASLGEMLPFKALRIQFQENIHVPVPIAEEAYAYRKFFSLLRESDPNLTIKSFAKLVGRSPSKISDSLRFCELPIEIRTLVEDKTIPYGSAMELWRLYKFGVAPDHLLSLAVGSVEEHLSVAALRKRVDEFIFSMTSGQGQMFALSPEEETKRRKRVVEENTVRYLWSTESYLRSVSNLAERGLLGKPDAPYSLGSPKRKVVETARVLGELVSGKLFSPVVRKHVKENLDRAALV